MLYPPSIPVPMPNINAIPPPPSNPFIIELDIEDDEICKREAVKTYATQYYAYEALDANLEYHLQYIYYCHGIIICENAQQAAQNQELTRKKATEEWLKTRTVQEQERYLNSYKPNASSSDLTATGAGIDKSLPAASQGMGLDPSQEVMPLSTPVITSINNDVSDCTCEVNHSVVAMESNMLLNSNNEVASGPAVTASSAEAVSTNACEI